MVALSIIESSKPELLLHESLLFQKAQTSDAEAHWYCNLKLGFRMTQEMVPKNVSTTLIVVNKKDNLQSDQKQMTLWVHI